jgi:hypothetical protein
VTIFQSCHHVILMPSPEQPFLSLSTSSPHGAPCAPVPPPQCVHLLPTSSSGAPHNFVIGTPLNLFISVSHVTFSCATPLMHAPRRRSLPMHGDAFPQSHATQTMVASCQSCVTTFRWTEKSGTQTRPLIKK